MTYDFEDKVFEKWHKLELGGFVSNKDLIANNKDSLSHSSAYHTVWCSNLRELFKEVNKTGYDFENFIDIGSGK